MNQFMPSVFSLIGSSWSFYKKQPVLNNVIGWMMILPITLTFMLSETMNNEAFLHQYILNQTGLTSFEFFAISFPISIALSLWVIWGTACVVIIGKRMIKSPAGRSRSSFATVRKQATKFIIPLFLTDILRDIFTIFWSLLLIVPGIIYRVQTLFFVIIIVCEGREYRKALKYSKKIIKGHSWSVFWCFLGLSIVIFIPASLIPMLTQEAIRSYNDMFLPVNHIISGATYGIAYAIYLLSTIALYKEVKGMKSK